MTKIIVNEELCTRIEMLQYEVNSRKDIITSYLKNNENGLNPLFTEYQDKYKEYFMAYNKAKQELIKTYNIPKGSIWNLDFATKELTY
jgi:hypothetical protein